MSNSTHRFKRGLAILMSFVLATGNPGFMAFAEEASQAGNEAVAEAVETDDADEVESDAGVTPEEPVVEVSTETGEPTQDGATDVIDVDEVQVEDEAAVEPSEQSVEVDGDTVSESAQGVLAMNDNTTYDIATGHVTINSDNVSSWNGRTVTGTVNAPCMNDASFQYHSSAGQRGAIIIDGTTVNLTISDLSITATSESGGNASVSPILLVNGATLNLTVEGTNTLTAAYGGAGICVPGGCTLTIGSASTGSLTTTGGDFGPYAQDGFAGGAGIGGAAKTKKDVDPSVGTITIAGGVITANGGGSINYGAAGIGGSSTSSAGSISIAGGTVNATGGYFAAGIGNGINGADAPHGGSISISGGTVTAAGSESAAGVGGGAYDSVSTISITGGTVSATSGRMGCAIGSGFGRNPQDMGTVVGAPNLSITGGNVTASGNIGHPTTGNYTTGGSFTLGDSADVSCTGEVTYKSATKHTINVTVYDSTIATELNSQSATLTLDNTVPVLGTATVNNTGVATFTINKIVDYGSADTLEKTVSVTAKIGNITFPTASNVLTKSSKTCNVYVGYRLHLTGTIFDQDISQGQAGTVKVGDNTIQNATITCTEGKAVIDGWLFVAEGNGVTDGSDYSAAVTVTIGTTPYGIGTVGTVAFKKTAAHQKTGAFQVGEDSIDYVDEIGNPQTSTGFTRLTNSTTALETDKWYAVFPGETIELSQGLMVGNDVHLILGDGATLNANAGIVVNAGGKLTIYSQSANTGVLNATGAQYCAGIGGGSGQSAGTIEVYGGTIMARGKDGGAGIGGGKGTTDHATGKSGTITIGGRANVEAIGSKGAAGIGGGIDGDGQTIAITGGTVRATGATDGNAQAQGAAGIGGGARTATGNTGSSGGTIAISGSATVIAKGGNGGAGIGGGSSYDAAYFGTGGTITIDDSAQVTATGGSYGAGIGSGYYGAESYITINGGTVNATGGEHSAGIGQGQSSRSISVSAGSVTISAGDITAKGGNRGPGIGCGDGGHNLPYINISGGVVNAVAGASAAGIGWGAQTNSHPSDLIVISGGQVTASSINAYNGRIHLSWTNKLTDYITCNGSYIAYNNSNGYGISIDGDPFMVQGKGVRAEITGKDSINFGTATIVPLLTATLQPGEGASGSMSPDDLTRGESYTMPECTFSSPEGKAFLGWQLGDDAENLRAPGYVVEDVADDLTLTAVWGQTYAVRVDEAVKSYVSVSPTPNLPGTTVTVTVDQPEYLDLVDGSLKATWKDGDTNAELAPQGGGKTYTFTMPAGDVTVTGRFSLNSTDISYVDAKGVAQTPKADYTRVQAENAQWAEDASNSGWYVVTESTTLESRVTVSGDVNLILCDGTTLTANKGINVAGDNSLTIWAQSLGDSKGALVASGNNPQDAGIGGKRYYANSRYYSERVGAITINGGCITATGGSYAAGIGSAGFGESSNNEVLDPGTITINGGSVEATGGLYAAAIGGGYKVGCGAISITGGMVVAKATPSDGPSGAAIGSGESGGCGDITISGGRVEALFATYGYGAGIGSGSSGSCGTITVSGGSVAVTTSANARGACIGTGEDGLCTAIEISGGSITATANGNGACIGSGATAADSNTPTTCGAIAISGGSITTTSTGDGAGIGSGLYSKCPSITISGGVVNATVEQGQHYGACIGHGQDGKNDENGCQVSITGGMVTASHGSTGASESLKRYVAAIGGGRDSEKVTIAISGGTVIAHGNDNLDNSSPKIPQVTSIGRGKNAKNINANDVVTLSYGDANDTCVYADCFGENVTLSNSFVNRDDSSQAYDAEKTYTTVAASEELRGKYLVAPNTHSITVAGGVQHGTVSPSVYRAQSGQAVTLTLTPDEGYKLLPDSLRVVNDSTGASIQSAPVENEPTEFTFIMPAADVTVTAAFFKHMFTYSAAGATITATCGADYCDLPDHKTTLTIVAPKGDLTYDGNAKRAMLTGDTENLGTPAISYTKDNAACADAPKEAGTYVASITLGEGGEAVTASVTYTIKPRYVTITGLGAEGKVYDGTTTARVAGTAVVSGKIGEDDVTAGDGVATFDTESVGTNKKVFFSGWTLTGSAAGNYKLAGQPASTTANITQKAVTVTAKTQSVEIGGTVSQDVANAELSDALDGHALGSVTLTSSSTAALTTSGTITPSAAVIKDASNADVTKNYDISYADGTLIVTHPKAKVTSAPTVGQLTYSGAAQKLVATDAVEAETPVEYALGTDGTTAPTDGWSASVPTGTNAGDYVVWYRAIADDTHITGDPVALKVSISKASLTIAAQPKTITYGDAPSNSGVSYEGFVGGETKTVLGGTLGYGYNYTRYGNVGSYAITPKGLTSSNYKITFKPGALTVGKKAVGISWGVTSLTYNGKVQAPTAAATGLVNGDRVSVTVGGAKTDAGSYTATATGLSGTKAGNYAIAPDIPKTATYTIAKASNVVKVAKTSVKKTVKLKKLEKKAQTVALPKVKATFGKATWKVAAKDKKKVLSLKNGKVMVKRGAKKGTYKIKLKASVRGTANYKAASTKVVTVKVTVG